MFLKQLVRRPWMLQTRQFRRSITGIMQTASLFQTNPTWCAGFSTGPQTQCTGCFMTSSALWVPRVSQHTSIGARQLLKKCQVCRAWQIGQLLLLFHIMWHIQTECSPISQGECFIKIMPFATASSNCWQKRQIAMAQSKAQLHGALGKN